MCWCGVGSVASAGFLQEETLYPALIGTCSAVVAALVAVRVLGKTGQWPGNVVGCYVVTAAYLLYGPGSVLVRPL
jgi:hypothetical protein